MPTDLISVIVPVYNAAPYLDECVRAILAQTYANFECILVNDGSTDNSLEICRKYADADSRVVVVNKPNGGVCSARNAGLDLARGQWVIFSDADDYYLSDSFRLLFEAATQAPDVDFAASSCLKLDCGKFYAVCRYDNEISSCPVAKTKNFALWGNIFRKSVIDENNLRFAPELKYSEDMTFMFGFLFHCRRMASVSDYTYVYRIVQTSACHSSDLLGMVRCQFKAISAMMSLQPHARNADEAAILRNHCELVARASVERVLQERQSLNALKTLKREVQTDCPVRLKTRLPFGLFCFTARLKGLKRRYLPRRGCPIDLP